jgi:hypothetical protein
MTKHSNSLVSPGIRAVLSDDGGVLIDVNQGIMFSLNLIGSIIWKHLAEGLSPENIVDLISRECQVERDLVLTDMNDFVAALVRQGLLSPNVAV